MRKKRELKAAPEFKPTALTDEAMEKVVGGIMGATNPVKSSLGSKLPEWTKKQ